MIKKIGIFLFVLILLYLLNNKYDLYRKGIVHETLIEKLIEKYENNENNENDENVLKSGVCKVGDVFGVYDGSECVLFKDCSTNQDCSSNDNYACCYNKCLLTDEFGSCPKSDKGERCYLSNGDSDCLNSENNFKMKCCGNPDYNLPPGIGKCISSFVNENNEKKCLPNKVNRARLGEKCYDDIECVDGGIKNNYKNIDGTDESGVVRCCKGSCTNILNSSDNPENKCPPSVVGETCKSTKDCLGYDTNDKIMCCNDLGGDLDSRQLGVCIKSCVKNNVGNCPKGIDPNTCQKRIGEECSSNPLQENDDICINGGTATKCCRGICTETVNKYESNNINNTIKNLTQNLIGSELTNAVNNFLNDNYGNSV